MKKGFTLVFAILFLQQLAAEWINTGSSNKLFNSNCESFSSTVLQFSLDGYESENLEKNGQLYQKISYQNEGKFLEVGKPDLPRFSRLIAIPQSGSVQLEINVIAEHYVSETIVYPAQELQSESICSIGVFHKDESLYGSSEIYPAILASADKPAILRDLRVVNITINPFQYDPLKKKLRIITDIEVTINTVGSRGENQKYGNKPISKGFEPVYQGAVLNYSDLPARDDFYQDPCYLFIYADEPDVLETLNYLTDWKHAKGYEVNIASTSETGTTLSEIKGYIQNAYNNWANPPEFVCLVGDAGGTYNIPTSHLDGGTYSGEGDQFYGLLEGDDILADVHLGRLSFNSISELQTIISKILNYEKEPFMDNTDWYNKVLLVGDPSSSGPSTIDTKKYIGEMINFYYPNMQNTEIYDTSQGSWVSQMVSQLSSGYSYFNYRGFAGMSGFDAYTVNNLSNGFMLPVAVTLTCITGDFEGTIDCRSEAFLKAGTPSNPKGAIAAIATATGNTHTCFNNCVDAGIFAGLFAEDIPNMGAALNRGKLNLYINYPGNPGNHVNQFSYWNTLMGDPGMDLWSAVPQEFMVNYDAQLPLGANFFTVNITNAGGVPQESAWVAIVQDNDTIFETAYTDAAGNAILPIPDNSAGTVNLTITKRNFKPHLGTFSIAQEQCFINIADYIIDDDNLGTSSGNNDGILNPGETIELSIDLQNSGLSIASSVTAVLSSDSGLVTISDNNESYGNIPAGATSSSNDDFDFTISVSANNCAEIEFDLFIQDNLGNEWIDHLSLSITAANLVCEAYTVIDGNNGILFPGETADLTLTLGNNGLLAAEEIYAELICESEFITLLDDSGYFGDINSNSSSTNNSDVFNLQAHTVTIPGSLIPFSIHIFSNSGYNDTLDFEIMVGEQQIDDPLGPDEFGYYCYDDGDIAYMEAPIYQWFEIDPAYGGSGTQLQLLDYGNMGAIENVSIPFEFTFYDLPYNEITVCSNGWISPGNTESTSFMNWEIPGPLGPSPIIAPFWDDLMTISGNVFYYHNLAQHFSVVEWSHLSNEYNADEETFQLLIYDQAYYPSANGNNIIKFQYKVVNNVDQGSYGTPVVGHGQYATVGIEDHTGTKGLQYTYNNEYAVAAKPLEDEMAISFNSSPAQHIEPFLILGDIIFSDENNNGVLEYGEIANLEITLNNIGQNGTSNISAVLSCEDDYVTLNSPTSTYLNLPGNSSGNNITDFIFQVADNCPDGYLLPFQLAITSDEDNWLLFFSLQVSSPNVIISDILVDDGNNNIFNPGENGNVTLTLENIGGSQALDLFCYLTTSDPHSTITSSTVAAGNIACGQSTEITFEMAVNSSATIQHEILLEAQLSTATNFSSTVDFSLFVSQVPVYLEEGFEIYPPTDWKINNSSTGGTGWQQNSSNAAGGQAPEIFCVCVPGQFSNERLESPVISTLGSMELILEYKQILLENLRDYTVRIETTDDGDNWNTVWEHDGQNIQPHTNYVTIDSPDVGSSTFQFAFVFEGTTQSVCGWLLDDVHLEEIETQPHGFIVGNVSLNGGNGNIEETIISTEGYAKNPDEDGNFLLPVPAGTYEVTAYLPQFEAETVTDVVVTDWEMVYVNFSLDEININNNPQNLIANTVFNDVHLDWDIPGSDRIGLRSRTQEKSIAQDNRELQGYNVYRDDEVITVINDFQVTSYNDLELDSGDYEYCITALYSEGESSPSNLELVTINLVPPQELVYQVTGPGMVLLQWDQPLPSREFSEYKVYRNNELIEEDLASTFYFDIGLSSGTFLYYVTAMYGQYESETSNHVTVEITDSNNNLLPLSTELKGNYPNPFNPTTNIDFSIKAKTEVKLFIYNMKGQQIRKLVDESMKSGQHSIRWNGKDDQSKKVSSGIYFYQMITEEYSATKKMIMLK